MPPKIVKSFLHRVVQCPLPLQIPSTYKHFYTVLSITSPPDHRAFSMNGRDRMENHKNMSGKISSFPKNRVHIYIQDVQFCMYSLYSRWTVLYVPYGSVKQTVLYRDRTVLYCTWPSPFECWEGLGTGTWLESPQIPQGGNHLQSIDIPNTDLFNIPHRYTMQCTMYFGKEFGWAKKREFH